MASGAPLKEILVVGFGAVGTMYSHILKQSGLARVTAVARSNFSMVNDHGIHIKSIKYGDISSWKPDRICSSVETAADQAYDYVILTTKAIPDIVRTPTILSPLLSTPYSGKFSQPIYVLLQNGINVEKDLYDTLKELDTKEPKIVSTALYIGTNLLAPDVVEHNHFDRLSLGWYRHNDFTTVENTPEEETGLLEIGRIFEKGGTEMSIVPEIQRVKFKKNFWNVAFSSISTLSMSGIQAIFRPPPSNPNAPYEPYVYPKTASYIEEYTIPSIKATLKELVNVARAMGFPNAEDGISDNLPDSVVEFTKSLHVRPDSNHKPSMMLDAEKGLAIEVEVIFGEVVRMAHQLNVDVPRLETLYGLLLVVQNQILRKMNS